MVNHIKERTMKYITVVRAKLKGSNPQAAHDATVEHLSVMTRPMGAIGHQAYLNPRGPTQFLAVDTWNNLEGLQKFTCNPDVAAASECVNGSETG